MAGAWVPEPAIQKEAPRRVIRVRIHTPLLSYVQEPFVFESSAQSSVPGAQRAASPREVREGFPEEVRFEMNRKEYMSLHQADGWGKSSPAVLFASFLFLCL